MDTVIGLFTKVFRPGVGRAAAVRTAGNRAAAITAAVQWWTKALTGRDGIETDKLESFGKALNADLSGRLEETYRVYLEVVHQPKGVLRDAALAAGLNLDAFPPATTMAVGDAKVEVSTSAHAPYESVYAAAAA
jgi:hypothetical protein